MPSFDMGGDSFYIEGLVKGLFSAYKVQRPTYNYAVHLFPFIQQLDAWLPEIPWSTRIGQALLLTTLALTLAIAYIHRASIVAIALGYFLLMQYWIHLSTPQVAFWSALIGGYAVVTRQMPFYLRLVGLAVFLFSITIRDISSLVALAILGCYLLLTNPLSHLPRFIPAFSLLTGAILVIAFSANLSLNPINYQIDNLLVLCNDWMLCDADSLSANDRVLYDLYFNAWFTPEGSPEVLAEMKNLVARTRPSFGSLFSMNRMEMNYLMISYHYWTAPLILILFWVLVGELWLAQQFWLWKWLILGVVFAVNFLRFFPYWTIDTFGGILLLLFITRRSRLLSLRVSVQYGLVACFLLGVGYSYYGSLPFAHYYKKAEAALPPPGKPVTVMGSMIYMWSLANMTPASHRPAMFQPGTQTKLYGLVDVGTNSEGLHKEVAQAGGFEKWLYAKTRGSYVFLSDSASVGTYLTYVRLRNPQSSLRFELSEKLFAYEVMGVRMPINRYTLRWD